MLVKYFEDCCHFAIDALDGVYGWMTEAIAVLIFVVICNFFVKWILKKLHLHFEKQNSFWRDSFVRALYTPFSYYVWFFAIIHVLDLVSVRVRDGFFIPNLQMILSLGGVIAVIWFIIRWKKNIVDVMIARSKRHEIIIDPGKIDAISKAGTVAIIFFGLLIILEITDHGMNTLIAFGGVGGLAVAFASQEIIANFFGGFMIYLTQPFAVGDWIVIPERNIEGHVEEIGWYTTCIRSMEKRPVYVPNSIFSKLILMNPSRMSHRQIKETVNLRYEEMTKVKEILKSFKAMLQGHPDIDQNQPIIVRLSSFGDYSLDILLNAFTQTINTDGYTRIKEDILFKIEEIVRQHGSDFGRPTHHIVLQE